MQTTVRVTLFAFSLLKFLFFYETIQPNIIFSDMVQLIRAH